MNIKILIWIGLLWITTGFSFAQKNTIEFDKEKYKFGKVNEGALVKMIFNFQNQDSIPVIFNSYKVNCDCTTVELPKHAVKPLSQDSIMVLFDSKHKIGFQQRSILINTTVGEYKLTFQGVVKASDKTLKEYKKSTK